MSQESKKALDEVIDRFAEVLASTQLGLNMVSVNEAKKGQFKSLLRQFSEAIRRSK